jgi:hypothetical protein
MPAPGLSSRNMPISTKPIFVLGAWALAETAKTAANNRPRAAKFNFFILLFKTP